ncbi:MAG: nucleotidyltransferase domain-containing protein [Dechloromonas sp.]|nr:nucleotidyltransferase domain-containing protein [Dechloromonas sp.]
MRKIDALIGCRTEERRRTAQACATKVLEAARENGYHVSLVGSLAKDRFRLHSDVDFLVHDEPAIGARSAVERLVAEQFRGTDIDYDLIFASDLTPERVRDMLHEDV